MLLKMKKNKSLIYRPQKLIPGFKIESGLSGLYAAVPDKKFNKKPFRIIYTTTKVESDGRIVAHMIEKSINSWDESKAFRKFYDHWSGEPYTLGYFKVCESL